MGRYMRLDVVHEILDAVVLPHYATLYQQVDAQSVTPFSPRALDHGLTAMLVSFLRLYGLISAATPVLPA